MKLTNLILLSAVVMVFSGCASHKQVAMNSYQPVTYTKVSGIQGHITKQMVLDAKRRRAEYIRTHGAIWFNL